MPSPRRFSAGIIADTAFSHSQGHWRTSRSVQIVSAPTPKAELLRTVGGRAVLIEEFAHELLWKKSASGLLTGHTRSNRQLECHLPSLRSLFLVFINSEIEKRQLIGRRRQYVAAAC